MKHPVLVNDAEHFNVFPRRAISFKQMIVGGLRVGGRKFGLPVANDATGESERALTGKAGLPGVKRALTKGKLTLTRESGL